MLSIFSIPQPETNRYNGKLLFRNYYALLENPEYIQCFRYVKGLEKNNLSNLFVANLTHKVIPIDTFECTNCVSVCRPCIK